MYCGSLLVRSIFTDMEGCYTVRQSIKASL